MGALLPRRATAVLALLAAMCLVMALAFAAGGAPPARQTRPVTWPASGRPAMSPVTC